MKLLKHEKVGLTLFILGILLTFIGYYWTPLVALGILLILIGGFLWNPLHLFIP